MNTIYRDLGHGLTEVPKHPDYELLHKQDQLEEFESKARKHRGWERDHRERAQEYEHMAERVREIIRIMKEHNRIHAEAEK